MFLLLHLFAFVARTTALDTVTHLPPPGVQLQPARNPRSNAVKDALRASTDAAIDAGVFGVPSFVVHASDNTHGGDKLFWGLDALPMLQDYLRKGCVRLPSAQRTGELPVPAPAVRTAKDAARMHEAPGRFLGIPTYMPCLSFLVSVLRSGFSLPRRVPVYSSSTSVLSFFVRVSQVPRTHTNNVHGVRQSYVWRRACSVAFWFFVLSQGHGGVCTISLGRQYHGSFWVTPSPVTASGGAVGCG